jgi:Ion channel
MKKAIFPDAARCASAAGKCRPARGQIQQRPSIGQGGVDGGARPGIVRAPPPKGVPMVAVLLACLVLLGVTTVIHYEALSLLNQKLPTLKVRSRAKLLVVIFVAFVAHAIEIALYGAAMYGLASTVVSAGLKGETDLTLLSCIYFSAETYTSLGFGDVVPVGAMRVLIGVEALNGLLLIGWSAAYAYIAMERYWVPKSSRRTP